MNGRYSGVIVNWGTRHQQFVGNERRKEKPQYTLRPVRNKQGVEKQIVPQQKKEKKRKRFG
jgi:hypothetical protein